MAGLLLSVAAMVLIVALRYLAVSGFFAFLTRRLHPGLHREPRMRRQMRREIGWSLVAAAIYGIPAGIAIVAWRRYDMTLIYTDPNAYHWAWLPLSVLVYLLVQDAWFYWTHRAMHRPPLFGLMHAVHHDSRPPTAWAAMAFHPLESISGAIVVPLLVFVVPIHVAALGTVLAIATFFGVTNHMGWEIFPRGLLKGPFGASIITATHHQLHHQHYRCNYGLYFRFWDRLCGTDRGLSGDMLHAGDHRDLRSRAAGRRGAGA